MLTYNRLGTAMLRAIGLLAIQCQFFKLLSAGCESDGYYHDATQPGDTNCPGYIKCEMGFYCRNLIKRPCPAGTYGDRMLLSSCFECPAGYYCPKQTVQPVPCGNTNHYCPLGSKAPMTVTRGYYSVGGGDEMIRTEEAICEPGFYCLQGIRRVCPGGTFGESFGLYSPGCTDKCPAGFYCPEGSSSPYDKSCTDDKSSYCPVGSYTPKFVDIGYYAIEAMSTFYSPGAVGQRQCEPGYYCPFDYDRGISKGERLPCPGGRYGSKFGEIFASCTGKCESRYFCPPGSTSSRQNECPAATFCPIGSAEPIIVKPGYYLTEGIPEQQMIQRICPKGSYCINGSRYECPQGSYGSSVGLKSSSCSGPCDPGYICPSGSTFSTQIKCGNATVYCPSGSASPKHVDPGYYTVGKLSISGAEQNVEDASIRFGQSICDYGHFCVNGQRFPCAEGLYGDSLGLINSTCSGFCAAGFFCPKASTGAKQIPCGSSRFFCPPQSAKPSAVQEGFCSTNGTRTRRTAEVLAKAGYFAQNGVCYKCPPGSYGSSTGLSSPACSGKCEPGYFCPGGSVSPRQVECGGANVYCPGENSHPFRVPEGFYTTIYDTEQCKPGYYRDMSTTSLTPHHSLGVTPVSVDYGDYLHPIASCKKCPEGTYKSVEGDSINLCIPCPKYTAKSSSDRRSCVCTRLAGGQTYNASAFALYFDGTQCIKLERSYANLPIGSQQYKSTRFTRSLIRQCEKGFYCVDGIRFRCPAGRYGNNYGETNPLCQGPCQSGFYCPMGSASAQQIKCGHSSVYCPEGSAVPTPVTPGYYTARIRRNGDLTGGDQDSNATTGIRNRQYPCEKGYFCINGRRYKCPVGRYGSEMKETNPKCTGSCARGFFCSAGSTTPYTIQCGEAWKVLKGLSPNTAVFCRTGCSVPEVVPLGYYSVGGSNTTRFYQKKCEPGYYCIDGVKYQCPEGSYGDSYGLQSAACSGKCESGYRCPSYPNLPSTSRKQNLCGSNNEFCPGGIGNHGIPSKSGYYTIGNDIATIRTGQRECEAGYFCINAKRFICNGGTFGSAPGISSSKCSGYCKPGYACAPGSTSAHQKKCPDGTYSIAGSSSCMKCPQKALTPNFIQKCHNRRHCCFSN